VRIAVFGGTGSLGWLVVRQAVEEGYGCKVLTRRAERMPEVPGVQFVQGDARDGGKVMLTLTGCDAAVVALRPGGGEQRGLLPAATSLVIAGMRKLDMERLLVVSRMGVGDSLQRLPLAERIAAMSLRRRVLREHEEQERLVRESDRRWTICRPARFVEGSATGAYRIDPEGTIPSRTITREDSAHCIVQEIANAHYTGRVIALTA
jgi:putative NADH-flavin reductase